MKLRSFIPLLALCSVLGSAQQNQETALKTSLDHFQAGEAFFAHNNYQSSANEFRESLTIDKIEPKWVEVWAHVNLGKIFDVTNQRERAIREYRRALATKDNTRGALDEAAKYLETPFAEK